jgi:hypothetical protein
MGCDVERIAPSNAERHPRHVARLQPPRHRCHDEGPWLQPPTSMSQRSRPTSTCHGKQSDASTRLTTWVSEEPATSGDPSPAAAGNHFCYADAESQRQKFIAMTVVADTLSAEFAGTYPHDTLRGCDSGQRKARGVRRRFLRVACGSLFQRCEEAQRHTLVTGGGQHTKTRTRNSPIIIVEKRL